MKEIDTYTKANVKQETKENGDIFLKRLISLNSLIKKTYRGDPFLEYLETNPKWKLAEHIDCLKEEINKHSQTNTAFFINRSNCVHHLRTYFKAWKELKLEFFKETYVKNSDVSRFLETLIFKDL